MARNPRPVKIKRHKNSMGSSAQGIAAVKRVLPFILAAVLVVALGFMLGKPLLNFISGAGNEESSSQDTVISRPDTSLPQETDDELLQDSSDSAQTVTPPVTETKTRIYYYTDVSALSTENGINTVIANMKNKGATHLVFDAKNPDGNVHYTSANRYASQLAAGTLVDIPALVTKLKTEGITPVARIYTFMDKMISTVERSTAVMYLGSDTRWLDTSAALGGKPWANPASKLMQEYIIALTDELLSMGITEIIYAGFSTPTGYSLDKRDFGATTQQVLANMQSLIGTLKAKISAKGGYSAWQFEYSAVAEDNYAQYIVHPYQLGAENMIVTAKGAEIDVAAASATLLTAENGEDIGEITLWLTDNADSAPTQTLGSWFVS